MCNHSRLERVKKNNGIQGTGIEGYDLIMYNCVDCHSTLTPYVRIHGEEIPTPENWENILKTA